MPKLVKQECPCCRKHIQTGDQWHCEDCWNKHHNGLVHHDWEDRETFEKNQLNRERIRGSD